MKYEWNEDKNASNFKKHHIWFEEAQTVWADAHSIEFLDPKYNDSEERYIRVGYSMNSRILLVVFCERNDGNTIRIISARKATANERKQYEKRI